MLPLLKINRYATQVFSIRLLGSRSVICKSGKILVQGQGVFGAIGSGDLKDAATFRPLALDRTSESEKNSMISAGWGHSAAVDDTGRLFIFGRPFDFPNLMRIDKIYKVSKWLARMVASSSNKFFGDVMGFYPSPTCFPSSSNVVDLSVSAGLTAFLTADGSVYCFGLNRWGQCGVEMEANMHQYTPLQVPGLPPCAKVEAGLQHCIALSRDGHVYTWGKANKGQLGTVTAKEAKDLPLSCPATQVMLGGAASPKFQSNATTSTASAKLKAIDISAGFAHSAAVTEDGAVYVWGRHMSAQLMNKDYGTGQVKVCEDQLLPRRITLPGNRKAVEVCSSNFNLVIRASDGSVWALGMGEHDRNANPLPLRVQSDFHFPRGTSATSACTTEGASGAKEGAGRVYAEVDPADGKHYLVLPLSQSSEGNGMLLRGHHRVTVVTEEAPVDVPAAQRALQERQVSAAADEILRGPTTVNRAHFPQQGLFEVVVHEGEAYLIELVLPMGSERNKEQPQYRLLNYSSGWRHNLMVVDTLK